MPPTQRFRSARTEPLSVPLDHLGSSLERVRRPRASVHSIIVANTVNANNQWIQLQLTRGSWVLMQPRRRKHSTSKSIFISAWKGRIKDFKIEVGKTTVKEVLVQHVYMHKELAISREEQSSLPTHRLHFVYPSSYEEWQPVECIIGIMNVVHSHIGQLQYEGRSSKSLADAGIFFYDHFYCLLDQNKSKGCLQQLPLHTEWNYLDWPIPDHFTMESVKSKLFKDIQKSLRGSIPTRVVKIIIYMPIIVFVELFHCCQVRITKTMLSCRNLKSTFLENLFDEGWSKRVHEHIHCNIAFHTVNVKYMIATQTFIMSFWYKRSRYIKGELIPLDQEAASLENDKVIHIEVYDTEFCLITDITLRESSNLQQLRQDILDECLEPYPSKFLFYHNGRKVLPRREKTILCKDLQNKVQLIST